MSVNSNPLADNVNDIEQQNQIVPVDQHNQIGQLDQQDQNDPVVQQNQIGQLGQQPDRAYNRHDLCWFCIGANYSCADSAEVIVSIILILFLFAAYAPVLLLFAYITTGSTYFLIGVLMVLQLKGAYAVTCIYFAGIAPTISHTIAQRYNPVAYVALDSINSLLFFTLGIILAGFSKNELQGLDWLFISLETSSIFLISLMLLFPAKFKLPEKEKYTPSRLGMEPKDWYEFHPHDGVSLERHVQILKVYNNTPEFSNKMHGILIGIGGVLGFVSIVLYLGLHYNGSPYQIYMIVMACVCVVSGLGFKLCRKFYIKRGADDRKEMLRVRVHLLSEIICLYALLLGMIALSLGAGDFIQTFNW